jgi:hypothetical protein
MARNLAARIGAVLPFFACLFCPICAPAIAGSLSALGVGVLSEGDAHSALIAGTLMVSLASAGWTAGRRNRGWPVVVAVLGAVAVVLGHFVIDFEPLEIGGAIVVAAASLWGMRARPVVVPA